MCFRPAEVGAGKNCPKCGATNKLNAVTCSACGESLALGGAAPAAPQAPRAPQVPGAPKAPVAPKAPGASASA